MSHFIRLIYPFSIGVVLAACSPDEPTAESTNDQKHKAMPQRVANASIPTLSLPNLETDIVPSLGQALSQSALVELKASTAMVPDLQNRNAPSEQNLIAKGDQASEVVSVTVRLNGNHVLAIDYTLSASKYQAQDRQRKLLKDYEKTQSHTISQLSPSLESVEVPVSDFRHQKYHNLRALSFEAGGVIRVILFDSNQVSSESLIPTVKSLPPGILESAKRALQLQRDLHEKREGK